MAKIGKKPREIFSIIDKKGQNSLNSEEFIEGIKNTLHLWLSEDECISLLEFLDEDKSGTLEIQEFDEKINSLNMKIRKQDTWMC